MKNYSMYDPESQCLALETRIAKELRGLIGGEIRAEWKEMDEPGLTHGFRAEVDLIDGERLELELYVNGEDEIPAGLEVFASTRWVPTDLVEYVSFARGFEGASRDVDPLNDDDQLVRLTNRLIRDTWERGDFTVERDDAGLRIDPGAEGTRVHLSTLPRAAWLGFVQELSLTQLLQVIARIEKHHGV